MSKNKVYEFNGSAFLAGAKAVVLFDNSTKFTDDTRDQKQTVTPKNKGTLKDKEIEFVYWGTDDKMPLQLLKKIYKNVTVASNIGFNSQMSYGDGVMVVRKVKDEAGKIQYQEVLESEQPEIFEFLENNNLNRILNEAGNDMVAFYDANIEIIINQEDKPKIVMLRHKEIVFSRLSIANEDTGKIEYHGYSAKWGEGSVDDAIVTPLLDRDAPIYDIKKRLGLLPDEKTGEKNKTDEKRFILSLALPTPGRFYYNKPYWWSIFESGWYDFACAIPAFKKALIENEMVLKYHVKINNKFFEKLYIEEAITDKKKQTERKKEFLLQMDGFLSGKDNAGKSFVSYFGFDKVKGYEEHDIVIEAIPSFLKGGEYIEDAEEASNMICYAMGVHPSLQGASPGKGKTINGTEARELFIIKQAMTKPIRDALLLPLYLCKAVNGWDKDIHFVIPNIMLTTLDKNTGAEKNIGNNKY